MILYNELHIITFFKLDLLLIYLLYKFKKFSKFFKKVFINNYFAYNFNLTAIVKQSYLLKSNFVKTNVLKLSITNCSFFLKHLQLKRKKKNLKFFLKKCNFINEELRIKIKKLIIKKIEDTVTVGIRYNIFFNEKNFFKKNMLLPTHNIISTILLPEFEDIQCFKKKASLIKINRLKIWQFKHNRVYQSTSAGKNSFNRKLFTHKCFNYDIAYSFLNLLKRKQQKWLRFLKIKKIRKTKFRNEVKNFRFPLEFRLILNNARFTKQKLEFFYNWETALFFRKIRLFHLKKHLLILKETHTIIFNKTKIYFLKSKTNVRTTLHKHNFYLTKHLFFYSFLLLKSRPIKFRLKIIKNYLKGFITWLKIKKQMIRLRKSYDKTVLQHFLTVNLHKLVKKRHKFFKKTTILVSKQFLFERNKKKYLKKKRSRNYKGRFFLLRLNNLTPQLMLKRRIYLFRLTYVKIAQKYLKYKNLFFKKFIRKIKSILYKNRKTYNRYFKLSKKLKTKSFALKYYLRGVLKNMLYLLKFSSLVKNINFLKYLSMGNIADGVMTKYKIPLTKRIFLKQKLINSHLIDYYYNSLKRYPNMKYTTRLLKFVKTRKKLEKTRKLIFLNVSQPLLGKLRETRKLHWNSVKTKKLNERRYSKFLKKTIYHRCSGVARSMLILLIFQIFGRLFSWHHLQLIITYKLYIINGLQYHNLSLKNGDLVEATISFYYKLLQKWFTLSNKKYLHRIKRWSFINYCRYRNPLLKKKKKLPKILKKLPIAFKSSKNLWLIDHSLHCAVFNNNSSQLNIASNLNIYNSTLLKLYNWRYVP